MQEISGGCLCGAVRYQAKAAPAMALKCYCTDCRRLSGTGHGSHIGFPKEAVTIEGVLTDYVRKGDSGNNVTRSFCPTCGTRVSARLEIVPDLTFFNAATLDDISLFKPQMAVYASRAPVWDQVNADLRAFALLPPANA